MSDKPFESWMLIGEALRQAHQSAAELVDSNLTTDTSYRKFRDVGEQLRQRIPDLTQISNPVRNRAIWMAKNREAITQWRSRLPSSEQQKLNHPNDVWRRYYDEVMSKPASKPAPAPAPKLVLKPSQESTAGEELQDKTLSVMKQLAVLLDELNDRGLEGMVKADIHDTAEDLRASLAELLVALSMREKQILARAQGRELITISKHATMH